MIGIPFVIFSILILFFYRRNGKKIDIACYVIGVYWISSFFSILIDFFDFRSNDVLYYKISQEATIVYCSLLTVCTLPLLWNTTAKLEQISKLRSSVPLKILTIVFFLFFLLVVLISLPSLINVLTGDFGAIRDEHYAGNGVEESPLASLPFIIRIPFTLMFLVTGCPWILQFLAFFCVTIQKMSIKYSFILLISSTIGIVQNVVQAGRSDVVYWLIGFGACYVVFNPYMSSELKSRLKKFSILLVSIFFLFLAISTISRFSDTSGGTESGLFSYAGQSFINFCYFYDEFESPLPSLQIIMPFSYYITGLSLGSIVDYQEALSLISGYKLGVFYTFLGQILVTSNKTVMYAFCIVFCCLSFILLHKRKKQNVDIFWLYKYMLFASVLYLGLFSHYYGLYNKTFSAVVFFFLFKYLCRKKRMKVVNNG